MDDFKEDSLVSFDITCYNKFYNLINAYCNINEMTQYYKKRIEKFKNKLDKNKDVKIEWLFFLI